MHIEVTKKKHSELTKKKISTSLKGRFTGESNPNWGNKGGGGREKGCCGRVRNGLGGVGQKSALKIRVKRRDNYTCQLCGLNEPEIMEVDHIKPKSMFPEIKNDMDNLMTLCPNCHKRKTVMDRKLGLIRHRIWKARVDKV